MKKQMYFWQVSRGGVAVEVLGLDKLGAVQEAARAWGLAWTEIARDCDVVRMRRAGK